MLNTHDSPPLILVVEDVPEVRELLADVLRSEGYAVAEAENGWEAWNRLRTGLRPELVLLDLLLPVMNGWDLLQRKQADPELRGIPTITLSALDSDPSELSEGCACHLRKPVSVTDLLRAVERYRSRRTHPAPARRELPLRPVTPVPPFGEPAALEIVGLGG